MKFSCSNCGQHIACEEAWAGHQIECPACHTSILVPQTHAPSISSSVSAPTKAGPPVSGPKLAAGVTQVPRSAAHAPVSDRRSIPRPPSSDNTLLKYGFLAAVVVALVGIGYFYGLPLLTNAFQEKPGTKSAGATSQTGGSMGGGPLGEMNEAMDVSDALNGGSAQRSAPRRHQQSATNTTARPRPAGPH